MRTFRIRRPTGLEERQYEHFRDAADRLIAEGKAYMIKMKPFSVRLSEGYSIERALLGGRRSRPGI